MVQVLVLPGLTPAVGVEGHKTCETTMWFFCGRQKERASCHVRKSRHGEKKTDKKTLKKRQQDVKKDRVLEEAHDVIGVPWLNSNMRGCVFKIIVRTSRARPGVML